MQPKIYLVLKGTAHEAALAAGLADIPLTILLEDRAQGETYATAPLSAKAAVIKAYASVAAPGPGDILFYTFREPAVDVVYTAA